MGKSDGEQINLLNTLAIIIFLLVFQEKKINLDWESNPEPLTF